MVPAYEILLSGVFQYGHNMQHEHPRCAEQHNRPYWRWQVLIVGAGLMISLLAFFLPRSKPTFKDLQREAVSDDRAVKGSRSEFPSYSTSGTGLARTHRPESAAQTVGRKAAQFAHSRREVLYAIARKLNATVPPEIEQFFNVAEAGNWEQLEAIFNKLQSERKLQPHAAELDQLWAPILATFNSFEQVHLWPPQEYLDYGNAILNSLRPGMVYVGGTDPGRGIPELLSDTADGEKHIVITQNGLADTTYLDYLRFQYGDNLRLPSPDDALSARADYIADYQKRLAHDQQFPNEPKQVLPGERAGSPSDFGDWSSTSIMAVNERLMQMILQANPDVPFGLEESFQLKSTYAEASSLGPIMELRGQNDQNPLTAETAAQAIAYWQNTAQQLQSDPAAADSPEWLKAYGKMADAQANLFVSHGLTDAAEQAFQVSLQISPGMPESVFGYVQLLVDQNRLQDALAVAQSAAQVYPDNQQFQNLVTHLHATSR